MALLRRLADAAMPNACVFCGAPRQPCEVPLCAACHDELPWVRSAPARSRLHAPLVYAFPVDAAIKALKFRRRLEYAPALGALLVEAAEALESGVDGILPVPLHWRRQAWRGFNQAAELCRPLARHLGAPLVRNVVRRRATAYQSGLSAAERRRNLRGAFAVRGRVTARHVLVVDDVVTTGATCAQLAAALRRAGAGTVSVLAVARAGIF
jgi:ComF family protein